MEIGALIAIIGSLAALVGIAIGWGVSIWRGGKAQGQRDERLEVMRTEVEATKRAITDHGRAEMDGIGRLETTMGAFRQDMRVQMQSMGEGLTEVRTKVGVLELAFPALAEKVGQTQEQVAFISGRIANGTGAGAPRTRKKVRQ